MTAKSAAQRWGEDRERHWYQELMQPTMAAQQKHEEVPTLEEFWPRFMDGHARANRHKPSGIAAKEMIGRVHLFPALGQRRLDSIRTEDVQRLKHDLGAKAPKSVNNILTVLNVLLRKAVEWQVIDRVPCSIKLLPISKGATAFHDFADYERLITAAGSLDWRTHLIVLLGGDAGLRCGEMMALEWTDVDLSNGHLVVRRSEWNGHVTSPKGGRSRQVPLTRRLLVALRACRHLRASRVLCQDNGEPLTRQMVQTKVKGAARRAGVQNDGVHVLRHTFCSHLAMRGAAVRSIQELAGHTELGMTQRYMHLSPAALCEAIRLLDCPTVPANRGDMLETQEGAERKASV
jgi:integrase